MRTLNRPMFKMGGPIKEGVMHGIREPYKGGGAALVGDPRFPKDQTGRAHHYTWIPSAAQGIMRVGPRVLPHIKRAGSAFKNIFRGTPTGQVPGWTPLTTGQKIKSWFGSAPAGKYLAGSPEGRLLSGGAGWAGAAGKKIGSVLKGAAKSPLTVGGVGYGVYRGIKGLGGDDAADVVTGDMIGAGPLHGVKEKKKGQGIETGSRGDFAKAEREARVNKYLDLMGYDRSKKMAIADALIDASKIVGDRGTLDKKNITQELINPIIQATSKRFDKPGQIREAVGLMTMKAEIEKDISKEKDALAKTLTMKKIEQADRSLEQGFETDIRTLLLSRKDKINKKQLEQYARLTADKYGEPFTVVDETTVIGKEPGIYMVEDKIFRVDENGQAEQIA